MQRRTFNKLLGASAAAAALGRFGLARADEPFKAGFVYVGPVADFGWTHQHDLGRQAAQKAIGDKLKTTYRREREGRPRFRARDPRARDRRQWHHLHHLLRVHESDRSRSPSNSQR